ncbi:family 78 glycoside hydrolase catalytic domain [Nocardiopsis sediminis]|uniref:alpha-L-rhamnosidase n=1 Tax=Nocardiopsis sediminis TaxID=1778267 RepID=A0ABV8FWQ1_9ACTN
MTATTSTAVRCSAPAVEHHREPFGIGEAAPRLSWRVHDAPAGWVQAGYEIEVADTDGGAPATTRVESAEQVLVPWPAAPLTSRARRTVRVRVRGAEGPPSPWSPPTVLETGLLDPADWTASVVAPDWDETPGTDRRPPLLRGAFRLRGPVARARLYASAHGLYEAEINGHPVGDHAMAPGWTSYHHRLRYQTHDVTALLREGDNAIGAWLGDGWYRGRLGFHGGTADLYGTEIGLLAQLEVVYADGGTETFGTGTAWRAAHGPILLSGIYDGESYDARAEQRGWSSPGFDDAGWQPVRTLPRDPATLAAPTGPPVRCTEEVRPVAVWTAPSGATLVDFGQNLVGRLRITVRGDAGRTVRLRHAEVLQDGELYTRPLRGAAATDAYTLRGDGAETWEPRFTFHGFRYAEITGWPGEVHPDDVTARVLHTDMARTGWFATSDPELDRLHDNVVWSMRGNFLDLPTDCPQRDERLGWTGDIQVFAPTASFLFDSAGMLASWLRDVADEQLPDGTVPVYVPVVPGGEWTSPAPPPVAVWGDVAVLTPWTLYERFGDRGLLRDQYASARAWVECVAGRAGAGRLWNTGMQLGDWLDPDAPPEDPAAAKSDRYLVATAYFARSAEVLARMAALVGEDRDHARYRDLSLEAAAAFAEAYLTDDGRTTDDAETSYALALVFGLVPEGLRQAAGDRLAEIVAAGGHHISTGFAGTPVISDALSSTGHDATAHALLAQRECPSWRYPVTQGATTVWERWDSLLPDGTVNPGEMTSFNHYALGAVADWLHRVVAGLSPAAPGYRTVLVRPRPGGGLTWARAVHDSPYGRIETAWRREGGRFTLDVVVPVGVTARVETPGGREEVVAHGRHRFTEPA